MNAKKDEPDERWPSKERVAEALESFVPTDKLEVVGNASFAGGGLRFGDPAPGEQLEMVLNTAQAIELDERQIRYMVETALDAAPVIAREEAKRLAVLLDALCTKNDSRTWEVLDGIGTARAVERQAQEEANKRLVDAFDRMTEHRKGLSHRLDCCETCAKMAIPEP